MKVGTVETFPDIEERKRRGVSVSGGTNRPGGSGGGRDPGGPGGDRPDDKTIRDEFLPAKGRIFTAFLLLVVFMTFGGLIAAYVVIATNRSLEWRPFALPLQVWVSTLLIAASSITYHFGQLSVNSDDHLRAKRWLIATTVLGAAFISSQLIVWLELRSRGLYVQGNPYAGFFFVLTAVHAVHVLGGVIALGSILLRVLSPAASEGEALRRRSIAQVVGWYWHFMGVLWIILAALLGFWK